MGARLRSMGLELDSQNYCVVHFYFNLHDYFARAANLLAGRNVKERGKYEVNYHNQENRFDHCGSGRLAHFFRTQSSAKAFGTSHRSDDDGEHHAFDQAGENITLDEGVEGRGEVARKGKTRADDAEDGASANAHKIGPESEARHHNEHANELRGDEEANRIEGHGFQRIDFLADLHGADFGSEG